MGYPDEDPIETGLQRVQPEQPEQRRKRLIDKLEELSVQALNWDLQNEPPLGDWGNMFHAAAEEIRSTL